jgi:hypothetical protein
MGMAFNSIDNRGGFAPYERRDPTAGLHAFGQFVIDKRRLGASWSGSAGMVGVSEHALRTAFDPDYQPPAGFARVAAAHTKPTPAPIVRPPSPFARTSAIDPAHSVTRQVLGALAAGPLDLDALGALTGCSHGTLSGILKGPAKRGAVTLTKRHGRRLGEWSLTELGRGYLESRPVHRSGVPAEKVLAALLKRPMTIIELSRATGGRRSTIATQVSQAQKRGHVQSAGVAPGSGCRAIRWDLTPFARQALTTGEVTKAEVGT